MENRNISMIVATDINNAIGYNNTIPWHLPKDFKYFKEKTRGHMVIMGRLTMESLPFPLPERRNLVLSRNPDLILNGFEHIGSMEKALNIIKKSGDRVFIIGGQDIYTQFLPFTYEIYQTKIDTVIENADTWFPELISDEWDLTDQEFNKCDERHKFNFSFNLYKRNIKKLN